MKIEIYVKSREIFDLLYILPLSSPFVNSNDKERDDRKTSQIGCSTVQTNEAEDFIFLS